MSQKIIEFPRGFWYTDRGVVEMEDRLQPYAEIADRIFKVKSAITAKGDSLTVFFQTVGKESPRFVLDDGSNIGPRCGLKELRFLFSAFEEFDLSVATSSKRGVFGFTFQRLKSDIQIPTVFDYPDESEQRCPDYFTEPFPDFYNPPEYDSMQNINLTGFQNFKSIGGFLKTAFEGIPHSVEGGDMDNIEDDGYDIEMLFGFSTQRVFRFTDEKMMALQKAVEIANDFSAFFGNYNGGYVLSLGFTVNDVRF